MGTFCSHHLPLRTLLPKLVFFLKNPIVFPSLVLITKLLLVLLNLFKIFLQRKQGTEMGFVFHPISTKYWFLKHYFLSCFLFNKNLVYGTYTISCFPLAYFTFEKNSTLLEKVSRPFWTPMFQLVFSQHFQIPFHLSSFPIVPRQLRCVLYLSIELYSKWQPLHILCTSLNYHIVSPHPPILDQMDDHLILSNGLPSTKP